MKRAMTISLILLVASLAAAGCTSEDDKSATTTTSGTQNTAEWADKWQSEVDLLVGRIDEWGAFAAEPAMNADMTQFLKDNAEAGHDALHAIEGAGAPPADLETDVDALKSALETAISTMEAAESCTGACTSERDAVTQALAAVGSAFDKVSEALAQAD